MPSSTGTFGSQPRRSRASEMSGWRTCGSSCGRGMKAMGDGLVLKSGAATPVECLCYAMTLPTVGSYRFTVVSTNAVGTSQPSAQSNLVTGQ